MVVDSVTVNSFIFKNIVSEDVHYILETQAVDSFLLKTSFSGSELRHLLLFITRT